VQAHAQKFWFVENPGKIPEKLGTRCKKICVWPPKKTFMFFVRVHERKFVRGSFAAQKFFGQVWGSFGENPSHPQTFACSCTYAINGMTSCKSSSPITNQLKQIESLIIFKIFSSHFAGITLLRCEIIIAWLIATQELRTLDFSASLSKTQRDWGLYLNFNNLSTS